MADVLIVKEGATAAVTGETEAGIAFVDAWLLGTLSPVLDAERVTITSEAINDLTKAATEQGLTSEVST